MRALDETHDPALRSWVPSANDPRGDFPVQNLPFSVFRRRGSGEAFRGGMAIGDQIVDLAAVAHGELFGGLAAEAAAACAGPTLNSFMVMGPQAWGALRWALSEALRAGSALEARLQVCLVPAAEAEHEVPARIGDYTDFYTSIHHATNVGALFRPDNPLLPNYRWVPIGYHGRSSSIDVSGQAFPRPLGQTKGPEAQTPSFGPCRRLDYELELGIFVGVGNELGALVPMEEAEDRIFGLCLLNDWSARDIQAWEYQPLGPFLAKSFATTLSPWIVTLEALAPYRLPFTREEGEPEPLAHLDSEANRAAGAFDVELRVMLHTERMRAAGAPPSTLATSSFRHAYWTAAQMLVHHASNGCNLQPGDLFGSGTLSGPSPAEVGSMLELTRGGTQRIRLDNGEERTFLEDGDTVIFRGWCEGRGKARIGFGEVSGTVLPARGT